MTILVDGAKNSPAAWSRRAREHAEPWMACGWSRESQTARFEKLLGALQPKACESLLDYGCGTGELSEWLHESVGYVGFDWSLGMVQRAREDHPGVRFESMLTDGETWDLVVCCGTFNLRDNWSKHQTFALMKMLWARTRRAMAVCLYYGTDPACIRYPATEVAPVAAVAAENFTIERTAPSNDLMVVLRR